MTLSWLTWHLAVTRRKTYYMKKIQNKKWVNKMVSYQHTQTPPSKILNTFQWFLMFASRCIKETDSVHTVACLAIKTYFITEEFKEKHQ